MKRMLLVVFIMLVLFSMIVIAGDKTSKTMDVGIDGMSCENCVNKVKTALENVEGVTSAQVLLASKTATVTYLEGKTDRDKITSAVNATGFKAQPVSSGCYDTAQDCCQKIESSPHECGAKDCCKDIE